MRKKGYLIDFEGLDCSFKETNTTKLYNHIKENITDKVILLSFPNYENESSLFVKKYLSGQYGKASDVDPYQASVCYAIDRYDTMKEINIEEKINEGYIVILDRYIGSNLVFQTTKLKNISTHEVDAYISWALDFEYNKLGLPKEDIVIYMNMPVEVSHEIMLERKLKNGMSTDGHENNYKFMKDVEDTAKSIIIPKLGYHIVDCINEDNSIKTEEEIFANILNILKKELTEE